MDGVTVTRIGTQVVVRVVGDLDHSRSLRLDAAVCEVERLVLQRVVIDLDDVGCIGQPGVDFLTTLSSRWRVRLLNAPEQARDIVSRGTLNIA